MGQRLGSEHSSTLSHCRAINMSPDTVCPSLDAGAAGESHRLSLGRPPPQGAKAAASWTLSPSPVGTCQVRVDASGVCCFEQSHAYRKY